MANVTISIQDDLLKNSRDYAKQHSISLNKLICELLSKAATHHEKDSWFEEFCKLADQTHANSHEWKWNRKELYDR